MVRFPHATSFDAAVARRTGEEVHTIRNRGFHPVCQSHFGDSSAVLHSPDDEACYVDWDRADAERTVAAFPLHRAHPAVA